MQTKLSALVILGFFILCCENVTDTQDKNSIQTIEEYREAISSELLVLYQSAQSHYRKPASLGGGGNSFYRWSIPDSLRETGIASYQYELLAPDTLSILGTGKITGEDNVNPVSVKLIGRPSNCELININ